MKAGGITLKPTINKSDLNSSEVKINFGKQQFKHHTDRKCINFTSMKNTVGNELYSLGRSLKKE